MQPRPGGSPGTAGSSRIHGVKSPGPRSQWGGGGLGLPGACWVGPGSSQVHLQPKIWANEDQRGFSATTRRVPAGSSQVH